MSPSVLTPPEHPGKKPHPLVRFSQDPETRSIQIGLVGTILFHVLILLLAPFLFRLAPVHPLTEKAPTQEFNIELEDDAAKQPSPPPPNQFVETNPDAPENEPDKTTNFAAQNQQVAQEKPTPDGRNDRPALEGKKDFESNQIVSGQLSQPVPSQPETPPALETPPREQTVAAPALEQNPLSGFEKIDGDDKASFGTNIAKASESAQPVPEKVNGLKDVPLIQGPTTTQPEIDPQRPRPRPMIVRQPQTRPAIFAENKIGTSNIGPIAIDAKWSNYGAYLQRMIETVQLQWERILSDSRVYPTSGSTVEVKFIMDVDGAITRVVKVDTTASDSASRACMSAITDRAPYGKWTDDMIAVLGKEQEMTFKFYYQ